MPFALEETVLLKETVAEDRARVRVESDTTITATGPVPYANTNTGSIRVMNARVAAGSTSQPRVDAGPAARPLRAPSVVRPAAIELAAPTAPRPADASSVNATPTAQASSPAGRPAEIPPAESQPASSRTGALRVTALPVAAPASPVASPAARAARRGGLHLDSPERLVPVLVAVFLLVATLTAAPAAIGVTGAGQGSGSAPRLVIGGEDGPNAAAANSLIVGGIDANSVDGTGSAVIDPPITANLASSTDVAGQFLDDGTLLKPVVVDTNVADGSDQLRSYKVRSGDTLTGIARRMGVSMMTIWWANNLKAKDALHVGQILVIPPVDGLIVTVKAGDTLDSIAKAQGLVADEIAAYNNLADRTLVIGQVLILPGAHGKAIATPKPTRRPVARVISGVTRVIPAPRPVPRDPGSYSGGVFAWPVPGGHISQYFWYGHPALDIAAPLGTPIVAAAGGTVTYAAWKNNGGGYQVWIAHGSGLYTTYNHMSSVSVSVGEHVGRGQFIGRVGSTGNSTGPHCHFEVWRGPIWAGGVRVNPLAYL